MKDYDDDDIAVRLMCGEEAGIEELINKYGRRVAAALRAKFPDISNEDRSLALRYAAFKAARAADSFDEKKASLPAWFTKIAFNVVIDMLRTGKTEFRKTIEAGIETLEDEHTAKPFSQENEEAVDPEQLEDLKQAIEELPEQLKRVVKADLAAGGQAHTVDLAGELGLGVATIRQYRKRYKETLYEIMFKKGHTGMKRRVRS
jgi:RNA polymerase sigma factor (sigma-70 family)